MRNSRLTCDICLLKAILPDYIWLKFDGNAIHFDEVIAIYMNMFQLTNFIIITNFH